MITFKKIRYKNFLSTGNDFTEILLNKSPTTLIVGQNGSGKCLRGRTVVEVNFDDAETMKKFQNFISYK